MKKRHWDQKTKTNSFITNLDSAKKRGLIPILPQLEADLLKLDVIKPLELQPQLPNQVQLNQNQPTKTPTSIVLLVSHVWSTEIYKWYTTIKTSLSAGCEIIVLACDKVFDVPQDVQILRPSIKEIEALYDYKMHKSLWASNHWILMWFWRYLGRSLNLDYVWSIEYDVRSQGDLKELWTIDFCDFLSTSPIKEDDSGYWASSIKWTLKKYICHKQIFRMSPKFLDYLDEQFKEGRNGQDEMSLATHAILGNFSTSSLKKYLHSSWSTCSQMSEAQLKAESNTEKLILFHPIK
jgi:hypothetical protein